MRSTSFVQAMRAALLAAAAAAGTTAQAEIWPGNSARQAIQSGAPLAAKRVATAEPAAYCAAATAPGTQFTWVDTVGSPLDYTHSWSLWATPCAGAVAKMRGAELFYAEHVDAVSGAVPDDPALRELVPQEVQRSTDGGAVVLLMPVDTAQQAAQLVARAYYPPLGTRSWGSNQAQTIYAAETADYRASFNDNVVLIAIVSTVEGAANARAIAQQPGIHAIFLDAMNLESSSGFAQGSSDYARLEAAIRSAAQAAGKHLCTADRSATPQALSCTKRVRGQ